MSLLRNIASGFRSLFRKEQVSKELARISQTKIEKGCRFWHNSFCPKEIVPEEATALWLQSVSRKACTSPPPRNREIRAQFDEHVEPPGIDPGHGQCQGPPEEDRGGPRGGGPAVRLDPLSGR